MKSIIQQASSIAKAIDEGWQKAGKPQHFSVKVLEHPEKNFFGFTTRSAKIAIYFEEEIKYDHSKDKSGYTKPKYAKEREVREPREQREQREPRERRERQERPVQETRVHESRELREVTPSPLQEEIGQKAAQKKYEPLWNDHMIGRLNAWLMGSLQAIDAQDVRFTIEPQQFRLRVTLSRPVLQNADQERQLLASFSALMLETLRKEFKTGFRGHKIVITHA